MRNQGWTRRESLLQCAALGALKFVPWLGLAEAVSALEAQEQDHTRKPTPWNEIGPFYKRLAPSTAVLRAPDDPGLPVIVSGRVFSTRGTPIEGAKMEIWQANHLGIYDLDGYRYRASLVAGSEGVYSFDSMMPGHYPGRVCQHIHYLVTAPGHKPLITQLYFATDPVFDGNPERNFNRDPLIRSRELVRPVTLSGDPRAIHANVDFEVVLERL
jgi:protocatechuate 3,4-dioxygenase beta subunit